MKRYIKLYLHGSKENAWDAGEKAGLTGEALSLFRFAGCEHAIIYDVDDQGNAVPIAIDGKMISAVPFAGKEGSAE